MGRIIIQTIVKQKSEKNSLQRAKTSIAIISFIKKNRTKRKLRRRRRRRIKTAHTHKHINIKIKASANGWSVTPLLRLRLRLGSYFHCCWSLDWNQSAHHRERNNSYVTWTQRPWFLFVCCCCPPPPPPIHKPTNGMNQRELSTCLRLTRAQVAVDIGLLSR